ncbi:uncharacterized protein [Glycine max]|uniref:uncharacterized protein n=1 Tax=Glycine max TaxID=3847 RepID=UPI0003DEA334|nr:uncharacterized protein LOC102665368 [Glycine max]|eukprot:XP_006595331.1 uncharacterized protein LOC102665368 [Glycine max]
MVPSKKEKDRHLARFLDIFRKLEISMPFGKALQQMSLYSKFLKDMLTMKHRRLGELEIMPTRMTLQLVDRSITRPYGVIEDVLVRVKYCIFLADFVVMDISEDIDISVILGRLFMLTASCIVDMGKRKLELGFEDQKIEFDLLVEDKPAP